MEHRSAQMDILIISNIGGLRQRASFRPGWILNTPLILPGLLSLERKVLQCLLRSLSYVIGLLAANHSQLFKDLGIEFSESNNTVRIRSSVTAELRI